MDFFNSALIQDDVLAIIALAVDGDWPVGPLFMHALGTLVEAVVVHDKVYYDPLRQTAKDHVSPGSLQAVIKESSFIQQLVRAGVLEYFPSRDEIEATLLAKGGEYTTEHFYQDFTRGTATFTPRTPEQEPERYEVLSDVVQHAPQIFVNESLSYSLPMSSQSTNVIDRALQANLLAKVIGIDDMEWAMMTAQNSIVRSLVDITSHLGANLYLAALAFPHQIGGIRRSNNKARELYEKMTAEVEAVDAEVVGLTAFSRVPIPPLAQIALVRCLDSPAALVEQIIALRDEHRGFRRSLTDIERAWNTVSSRRELNEFDNLFQNGWDTLLSESRSPKYRLIYPVWDIVSKFLETGPSGVIKGAGDKASERGRKSYVINRVAGTHDFYEAMRDSPPQRENARILKRLFPQIMDETVWQLAGDLGTRVEQHLVQQPPTSGGFVPRTS
jgi:hypothetical protein